MHSVTRINFNSHEERKTFNSIIITSETQSEAIEKVKKLIKDDNGNPVSTSVAMTAVARFWDKKAELIKKWG